MREANCYTGRGKRGKIPLLSENLDKRSVNNLGTLQRVTTEGKKDEGTWKKGKMA